MGLKQDLINAKIKAAKDTGITEPLDTKPGSMIERDAHYTTEAIGKFMTEANFTITQLKAPIILESLKTPEQGVNMQLATLLGDKAPILDTLKKVGGMIPGAGSVINKLIAQLESSIKQAVMPLLEGGATLPGLDLGKSSTNTKNRGSGTAGGGGLKSTGYVYIGEDPDSQGSFNVEDEDGQREFTTVKLIADDLEELL